MEGDIALARYVGFGIFGYWPAKITKISMHDAQVKFYETGRAEGEQSQSVLLSSLRPFPKKAPKKARTRWRKAWLAQLAKRYAPPPPSPPAPNPFQPPSSQEEEVPLFVPSFSPSSFLSLLPPQEEEVPFPSSSPSFNSSFLQTPSSPTSQSSSNPLPPSSSPRRWSGINDLTESVVFINKVKELLKKKRRKFGPWKVFVMTNFPHGATICGKRTPGALRHHVELFHTRDKQSFPCMDN